MRNKQKKGKPKKFSGGAKVTLTALSLLGFFSGWNVIGRIENQEKLPVQPSDTPNSGLPVALSFSTPTPWPTIAPLADIPPIPTLRSDLRISGSSLQPVAANITLNVVPTPLSLEPLPTFAPLPPIPSMPEPQPLPQVMPANGWQQSGAS